MLALLPFFLLSAVAGELPEVKPAVPPRDPPVPIPPEPRGADALRARIEERLDVDDSEGLPEAPPPKPAPPVEAVPADPPPRARRPAERPKDPETEAMIRALWGRRGLPIDTLDERLSLPRKLRPPPGTPRPAFVAYLRMGCNRDEALALIKLDKLTRYERVATVEAVFKEDPSVEAGWAALLRTGLATCSAWQERVLGGGHDGR